MTKHIVLGATGNVGHAVALELLNSGELVIAVVHDASDAGPLEKAGAQIAEVDVGDSDALRAVFHLGHRAFLLNPPAPPDIDKDAAERRTVASILAALDGSGLEKVVAASTYGAQPADALGDLSVLYEFEQGLEFQAIPAAINRGAYYFVNWDASLDAARSTGVIQTPFPANFLLPMVDPADLGIAAARRMLSGLDDVGIEHVEGPARYTPNDVADAFSVELGRPVRIETVPREGIEAAFRKLGFSAAAAQSYANMTKLTLDDPAFPDTPERGSRTLWNHIAGLVNKPV